MSLLYLLLFLLMAGSRAALPVPNAKPDTLPARESGQAKQTSRLPPAPMIMPGTRLDTNFRAISAQSPTVGRAAPAWLRAKATGTPMYVVNGKVATAPQMRALRQTDVVSVNVLEGSRAAMLYGKNARGGMVIITTRKGLASPKH